MKISIYIGTVFSFKYMLLFIIDHRLAEQIAKSLRYSVQQIKAVIDDINRLLESFPPVLNRQAITYKMVQQPDSPFWQDYQNVFSGMFQYHDRRRALEEIQIIKVLHILRVHS